MKTILTFLFNMFLMSASGQNSDSLLIIQGPEKYKAEVARIFEKYGRISDSLTQIGVANKFKSDTSYKNGYNAQVVGLYIERELKEMENILTQFLNIKRVTAIYKQIDAIKKEKRYTVSFIWSGESQRNGIVKWVVGYD